MTMRYVKLSLSLILCCAFQYCNVLIISKVGHNSFVLLKLVGVLASPAYVYKFWTPNIISFGLQNLYVRFFDTKRFFVCSPINVRTFFGHQTKKRLVSKICTYSQFGGCCCWRLSFEFEFVKSAIDSLFKRMIN